MRGLKLLGAAPYQNNERTATTVLLYLLSVRLKSTSVCPIELAEFTGLHKRSAQRFIYNSFTHAPVASINLETLTSILNFVNLSLTDLFSAVELFKNSDYVYATFNLPTNSYSFWYREELECNDTSHLEKLLQHRSAVVVKFEGKMRKFVLVTVDNLISQYPKHLINKTKGSYFNRTFA